jgi:hypothetical protein
MLSTDVTADVTDARPQSTNAPATPFSKQV